jgi:NADH:ubiquinone oxidoreductase subunit 4 (subunit M)
LGGSGAVWSSLALSAGLGIVQGASFAALAQLNPTAQTRASAAGAIAQLGNIGTTCGTPMLAFLIAQTGMPGVVGFVVGFSALGMGLHLWQAKRRKGGIPAR